MDRKSRRLATIYHLKPLFPKPRPSNRKLITVDCCQSCNHSASKDDEYFRSLLVREKRIDEHPQARKVNQSFIRSLDRKKAPGFRKSILDNVFSVEMSTLGGIYIGREWGYYVENDRLDRVLARITKGLFWKDCGMRLPDDYGIICWDAYRLAELDRDAQVEFYNNFAPMIGPPKMKIGDNTFCYWYRLDDDGVFKTAWVLGFYSRIFFYCITWPKE